MLQQNNEVLVMIEPEKGPVVLILLSLSFIIITQCLCHVQSSESEDDKLKQALILVDILKSEYVKALEENSNLRDGKQHSVADESTCASTTDFDGLNKNNFINSDDTKPPYSKWQSGDSLLFYSKPLQQTAKLAAVQTGRSTAPPIRNDAATTPQQLHGYRRILPLNVHEKPKNNHLSFGYIDKDLHKNKKKKTTNITFRKVTTISKANYVNHVNAPMSTKRSNISKVSQVSRRKNLIMDQVAAEFMNELKEVRRNDDNYRTRFTAFRRSTLKIHMGRSTRLSLPLPENNAFCFTNPLSSLCRTLI